MGRYVGKGKNRRYQVKHGKRWVFAKAPSRRRATTRKRTTRRRNTSRKRRRTAVRRRSPVRRNNPGGRRMSKRPSAAVAATVISLGQAYTSMLDGAVSRAEGLAGVSLASATTTLWGLKAASSLFPSFGAKYRGFLGSVGFKP